MARKIFMWMTILSVVVLVAGIAALIYAFVSDSQYDPNAVVTDSNGFTSRGAYTTNSAWAWVGGIGIGIGMTALFVGIFGWITTALLDAGKSVFGRMRPALTQAGFGGLGGLGTPPAPPQNPVWMPSTPPMPPQPPQPPSGPPPPG